MIIKHPESKSVATGAPAAFTVEASGDALQFQWQRDGKNIDSNMSWLQCSQSNEISTLQIEHVEISDKGHYNCIVKSPVEGCEKLSLAAELTICEFFYGVE